MVFQLHPQGYHFAAGHVAKLELLPSDLPYGRFSNLQSTSPSPTWNCAYR